MVEWNAQTIHALRILRSYGMQTESIHTIYRAVVLAKLTQASSAWWGFTTATDRQTKTKSCHSTRHSIRTLIILQPVILG